MEKILSLRWKVLFFSICVAVVFGLGVSVDSAYAAPTSTTSTCSDSDGGKNYLEQGVVNFVSPWNSVTKTDKCLGQEGYYGPMLQEFFCDNTGYFTSSTYDCNNIKEGSICSVGACIYAVTSTMNGCNDTDNGKNIFVKGGILYGDEGVVGQTDFCDYAGEFISSGNGIVEQFCMSNGEGWHTYLECPDNYECFDGACVPTSTPPTSTSTQLCYDGDGGLDYYTKSHFIGEMYQGVGSPAYHLDSYDACTDATRLSEYFCYKKGDIMPQFSAWGSNVPEGKTWGTWHTYDCAKEGKVCSDGKCVTSGGSTTSSQDVVGQEEQNSAEDLAEEVVDLEDENTGGNYGYDYGYDYGYSYGGQASKSTKINKALNPKMLPDSPFYMFKQAGKGLRSWFTFDKAEKAKLRMRYAAEKLLEANKLIEKGENEEAAQHMDRYAKDIEKLNKIMSDLEQKDEARARELANIALRLRLKEQVLLGKVERESPATELESVKEARRRALVDVEVNAERVRDPESVKRTFELALDVNTGEMNSARKLEILEAVQRTGLTESTGEAVRDLTQRYSQRLEKQVSDSAGRGGLRLADYVENAGGDEVNYLRMLDNLDRRVVNEVAREEVASSVARVATRIENRIGEADVNQRRAATADVLSGLSSESGRDVSIIREVERRIDPKLSASVREVRQELEQRITERPEETRVVGRSFVCPSGFVEQDSYLRDCKQRPEKTVCVKFNDGYIWLVGDAIAGWAMEGERIQISNGVSAEYHHLLGTDCVKLVGDKAAVQVELPKEEITEREEAVQRVESDAPRQVEPVRVETRTPETVTPTRPRVEEVPTQPVVRPVERPVSVPTLIPTPTPATTPTPAPAPTPTRTPAEVPTTNVEVRCTQDTWDCGDWTACSDSGTQTRTCRLSNDCEYVSTPSPVQSQSCTPPVVVARNPDLTVTSFTYSPTTITVGNAVSFVATIYNQGDGDAAASTAYVYVDDRVVGSLSNRTLVAGARESLTWSSIWSATVGDHTIKVCADAINALNETDESNNCSSSRLTVQEAARTGGRVSLGAQVMGELVTMFFPATQAFMFGDEVLRSN